MLHHEELLLLAPPLSNGDGHLHHLSHDHLTARRLQYAQQAALHWQLQPLYHFLLYEATSRCWLLLPAQVLLLLPVLLPILLLLPHLVLRPGSYVSLQHMELLGVTSFPAAEDSFGWFFTTSSS